VKQIARPAGNEVKQMKTIFLRPMLNPAFKITQPLPMIPEGFVARHAWAARPFSAQADRADAFGLKVAASHRCVMTLGNDILPQSTRLVA
jgi:hypothetical protein